MAPASFYVVQSDLDAAPSDPFSSPTSTPVSAPSSRSIDPVAAVEGSILSPIAAKPNAGPAQRFRSGFQDLVQQNEAVQHLHVRALAARSTSLAPNDSQKVTLGVIAAYIVIISILWVTPVIKWILWPFKASRFGSLLGFPGLWLRADLQCRISRCSQSPFTSFRMPRRAVAPAPRSSLSNWIRARADAP